MKLTENFQLTYCTNVHPGSDWATTFQTLEEYVPVIKKQVTGTSDFGLGLRLSNKASEELGTAKRLQEFKKWLDDNGVYVFTMNGFPYGNFHNERVKDDVHTPDWTTKERLEYTKRLFDQLLVLLPEGMNGGISTSPISYKYWHKGEAATKLAFEKGTEHLLQVILHLQGLEEKTGVYMHLDLEPEPDGLLENSDEVLSYFKEYLIPMGVSFLMDELEISEREAKALIHRYITVCYDICHFSLAFEEPEDTFAKFRNAGIQIGKIQVSAALKIISNKENNNPVWEALSQFDEPVYLHQVTEFKDGKVTTYSDLPEVLKVKNPFEELRAHFHVPIFLEQFGELYSTQDHILKVIEFIRQNPVSEHLEIETYTWDVLPQALKRDLTESVVRELNWFKDKFD
ncbi:metabolite traffic protein EboE [Euzebyella saccharophila]|uniref:Metabolite traffic protein EboE n=1 Tax=Euzebyella saccharophila TaxID=679664 RepID=A0ABV8JPL8_9FLAO|nr:metabolite traffic protein EboE [Euzebyella saccharophila]MDO1499459.1 metabolite traffic protein EboE [Winogradskyella maritima]